MERIKLPEKQLQNVLLEGRRILYRNFSGVEGRFNAKGDRNFNVLLEDDEAERMLEDGWNVKYLQPRDEEDKPQPRLEVAVSFKNRPPNVVLLTDHGKTQLDESMVSLLDWADIINVDLIIRPYQWEVGGRTGVKAYVKSLYVKIQEDDLEKKYYDVPDSAAGVMLHVEEPAEETP